MIEFKNNVLLQTVNYLVYLKNDINSLRARIAELSLKNPEISKEPINILSKEEKEKQKRFETIESEIEDIFSEDYEVLSSYLVNHLNKNCFEGTYVNSLVPVELAKGTQSVMVIHLKGSNPMDFMTDKKMACVGFKNGNKCCIIKPKHKIKNTFGEILFSCHNISISSKELEKLYGPLDERYLTGPFQEAVSSFAEEKIFSKKYKLTPI